MKDIDVELIYRVLDGDDNAFETLVKKYRKPVHALVWRKIGDFHIAEEITQDTFLKAYQELAKLKKPQSFASWLYVIAANQCSSWLRKKRLRTQPIEETSSVQLEKATYSGYIIEENERTAIETQREVVKNLLAKLQESDRTVITLHYFGDMSAAEIGSFLGVSVNTIKSRLRRAQQRLKREESMVRAALEHFQITPNLTENIMREVSRMRPVTPSGSKPLIPVTLSAATAVLIFLIMGMGSQYLARFQKPYNIDAQSEMTVEIIDAPVVLDTQAKPALRSQAGRFETPGKRSSTGLQLSKPVVPGAARVEKETRPSTQQQWTQASGFTEGTVLSLLRSAEGDIYAPSPVGVYRLTPSTSTWTLINAAVTATGNAPMAERGDTLYLVSNSEVLASMNKGETWQSLGARPEGKAIGLVTTDEGLYIALDNQVFRSTDAGKQWIPLNEKIEDGLVLAIAAVENTVFVGTTQGLYRAYAEIWEKLPMDTTKAVHSLAVSENNLYVGTGPDLFQIGTSEGKASYFAQAMGNANSGLWEIFHSTDLGNSWTEITPASQSLFMKMSPGVKVLASGETLLVLGLMSTFHSSDSGKTWTEFVNFDADSIDTKSVAGLMTLSIFPAMAADENTFFKVGPFGVTRSTDAGKSWNLFTKGIVDTRIVNLMAFKNGLYVNTGTAIAKSTDGGDSWNALRIDTSERTRKPAAALRAARQHGDRQQHQSVLTQKSPEVEHPTDFLIFFPKLTISDDVLYGIVPKVEKEIEPHIFYLSADRSILVPIKRVPPFPSDLPINKLSAASQEAVPESRAEDTSGDAESTDDFTNTAQQMDPSQHIEKYPSGFAVSGEMFYVEYQRRLLRWKRGEREWFNTGLIDMAGLSNDFGSLGDNRQNLKLAVSGETVYTGKRDGHLFRSHDGGNTWKDLTSNLPLRFEHINEIVFVGSTVYVATDTGVLTSVDDEHWRVITDKTGVNSIIDRVAVAGTTVYGVGKSGAHLLDKRGEWEKISPEVPGNIIAATINGNRLYVATEQRGMFHVSLENENN